MNGLNLHVYPSAMVNESRLFRISGSIAEARIFDETHLIGVADDALPACEALREGVQIVRIASLDRLPGAAGKVLRALSWQLAVFRAYRREPVRVVNAHSVWMLPLCWLLARRTGATLFYNPHELETQTPTMRGIKQAAAELIERSLIGRAKVVSVVNGSIAQWYDARYRIPRPVAVRNIPVSTGEPAALRETLGVSADTMLFIHTGRLTGGRSIEQVLEAFEQAQGPHVVFLGDGPLGADVRRRANRSPVVHWLAPVAPERVVDHVREADVALCLIETSSLSYRYSSPNKLFEALAASTPPLCSDLVEARLLLGDHADQWILTNVEARLPAAIAALDASDVDLFRKEWAGLPTWEDEVAPLMELYVRAAGGAAR